MEVAQYVPSRKLEIVADVGAMYVEMKHIFSERKYVFYFGCMNYEVTSFIPYCSTIHPLISCSDGTLMYQ
ncbi:hypothetical protein GE061_011367 [Apolygus lucorum]|uniref:Uncharacterized protein n=1 Tax=Apolygus lucorum TaxID=248454 RepID=A0A6A4JSS9_APOLU|nr:hypothetical protein GE061_011367 [Apolygus lucorum]